MLLILLIYQHALSLITEVSFFVLWVLNMVHPSTLGEGVDLPMRHPANDLP